MKKLALHWQIFIGLVLGVVFGLLFGSEVSYVSWLGDLFIQALKMIIVPLIITSILLVPGWPEPKAMFVPANWPCKDWSTLTLGLFATVFAGQDTGATAKAREYMGPFPPSSPSIALFKDGKLVHFIERHHIEGRSAQMIADNLKDAFTQVC